MQGGGRKVLDVPMGMGWWWKYCGMCNGPAVLAEDTLLNLAMGCCIGGNCAGCSNEGAAIEETAVSFSMMMWGN